MNADDLVGKLMNRHIPYVKFGKGMEGFDCWGLVWFFYKELFDINIVVKHMQFSKSDVSDEIESNRNNGKWVQLTSPEESAVCLMYKNGRPLHIGVTYKNKILNAIQSRGVCLTSATALETIFTKLEFYKWQP